MKTGAKLALVVVALGLLYWPGIQHHWEAAQDRYFAPFDAAQYIPAFFKFDPNDPIPTTYAKEYYLNAVCPLLYKWSIIAGAQFFDVRGFQLGMMYLAYGVFLGTMGRLGWLLGGATLSFAVIALTFTAWIFFGLGFIGGAPRMYAYPLMALILFALIRDRPYLLAATVILGGLLYPIVALIGGCCLAGWLLVSPLCRHGRVSRWRLSRRLALVALTGFLTSAALAPLVLGARSYGRRVVEADISKYPEAGPDGNYRSYDQLPYKLVGSEWTIYFAGPMYSHGDPIVQQLNVHQNFTRTTLLLIFAITGLIALTVILCGMRLIIKDSVGMAMRLIGFFVVCGILHIVAWLAAPYLYIPARYFMFSLPFLLTFIFPWSLSLLLRRAPQLQSSPRISIAILLGIISVYLIAFGGRGNVDFSNAVVEKPVRPLFDAIAALPKNSLIAGWPVGPLRKLEYVTRRNVFLSGDLHQVLHLNFMQAMRERMDAMFDAYLSADEAPLRRLRQDFGVTHLIVETRDFTDPNHAPEYFAPWRARINPRLSEIKGKEYLLKDTVRRKAAIFDRDGLILLDLANLP